ncbi:MAG: hypothetical protein WDA03_14855, partial [Trueperaceae bacterium]
MKPWWSWQYLSRILPAGRPREALSVILTAAVVGALSGLAAVAFDVSVRLTGENLASLPQLL